MSNDATVAGQLASVELYARLVAQGSLSARLYKGAAGVASVCPEAPTQPMANVVTCRDAGGLMPLLVDVEQAYAQAGISAWQLWDGVGADRAALDAAGYRHSGHMPGMTIELENLPPIGLDETEYVEHHDLRIVGEVNATAYPHGDQLAAALVVDPISLVTRVYEARRAGATAAAMCVVYPSEGKAVTPLFLATHPNARGQRFGQRLLVTALWEARRDGYDIAHLQASAQGAPIYAKLGFEPVGDALFNVYTRDKSAA
jgi:GNAT superfamily N-acetyltransferase